MPGLTDEILPRERVLKALSHKRPDRVPLFYRSVPEVDRRLIKDLNLKSVEEIYLYFDIDFRWVKPEYIGPPLFEDGSDVMRDIWGCKYKYVKFGQEEGYWEITEHPLAKFEDKAAIKDYQWPQLSWFDFSCIGKQIDKYQRYAIMTAPGFSSPSLFQCPIQTLLGDEKAFIDMVANVEFFDALVEKVLDFQVPFIKEMMSAGKGRIDFFRIGDDFGTQKGLLFSEQLWEQRIAAGLKAMADAAKKFGTHYYQHSCGSIRKLIPQFINIGVDVLDPLQVTAEGMSPSELKKEYGQKICFSGGVDEQYLLRTGSYDDIRKNVNVLLDEMAYDGGFFIGPTHNFQADIPTANILAMYDAAKEWK